jgi:hypothetical protein
VLFPQIFGGLLTVVPEVIVLGVYLYLVMMTAREQPA